MKRKASTAGLRSDKRRKAQRITGPARAYSGSRVPLASRGYRLNAVERKLADFNATVIPCNSTSVITPICIPTLGTDFTNRVGRKILIKSIQGRLLLRSTLSETITVPTNGSSGSQMCRLLIIVDMQPNGAAPAITDIMTNNHPAANMNLNNRDRFKVLLDKTWVLDPFVADNTATLSRAGTANQAKTWKFYKKCNQETIFNATNGGTIADITSGALLRVIMGNQPPPVAGPPAVGAAEFVISSRVRFVDM